MVISVEAGHTDTDTMLVHTDTVQVQVDSDGSQVPYSRAIRLLLFFTPSDDFICEADNIFLNKSHGLASVKQGLR